jgi:hypothetical protein
MPKDLSTGRCRYWKASIDAQADPFNLDFTESEIVFGTVAELITFYMPARDPAEEAPFTVIADDPSGGAGSMTRCWSQADVEAAKVKWEQGGHTNFCTIL